MSIPRSELINMFRARIKEGRRTKLQKQELAQLIEFFLDRIGQASTPEDIHDICREEITLLEEGYQKLTLASIYIPRYRSAIKTAIAENRLPITPSTSHEYHYQQRVTGKREIRCEHWALTYLKYTPEEYEQLDTRQAQVNQTRLLNLKSVRLDRYLEEIESLLYSQHDFAARHRAIAIAALTGRRMGEVVVRGEFSLTRHPYLLHFTGQQKYERNGYDIITLIPASTLLACITEFRAMKEIRDFRRLSEQALKEQLNKFDVQVNQECNKRLNLTHIVPPLEGKKKVTIHNLRSLWGAIATYFFCPEDHHEYAFLQHYLGHVLKSSATGHYFRYRLVGPDGKFLKRKGIKLPIIPKLLLVDSYENETFSRPSFFDTAAESYTHNQDFISVQKLAKIRLQWCKRWEKLVIRLKILEPESSSLFQLTVPEITKNIKSLEEANQILSVENQQLCQELEQAELKLEQFRQLLFGL